MNISTALKAKSRLILEIRHLQDKIRNENVATIYKPKTAHTWLQAERKFDHEKLHAELDIKIKELIDLKTKISIANQGIAAELNALAEYKTLLSFWNNLTVDERVVTTSSTEPDVAYVSFIGEVARDQKVKEIQQKINDLQDSIDTFNSHTQI